MQQRIYTNTRGKKIRLLSRNHQSYDPTFILFDCGRDGGIDSWLERKTYHLKTGQIVKNELMTIPIFTCAWHQMEIFVSHKRCYWPGITCAVSCLLVVYPPFVLYSFRIVDLRFVKRKRHALKFMKSAWREKNGLRVGMTLDTQISRCYQETLRGIRVWLLVSRGVVTVRSKSGMRIWPTKFEHGYLPSLLEDGSALRLRK